MYKNHKENKMGILNVSRYKPLKYKWCITFQLPAPYTYTHGHVEGLITLSHRRKGYLFIQNRAAV